MDGGRVDGGVGGKGKVAEKRVRVQCQHTMLWGIQEALGVSTGTQGAPEIVVGHRRGAGSWRWH